MLIVWLLFPGGAEIQGVQEDNPVHGVSAHQRIRDQDKDLDPLLFHFCMCLERMFSVCIGQG